MIGREKSEVLAPNLGKSREKVTAFPAEELNHGMIMMVPGERMVEYHGQII